HLAPRPDDPALPPPVVFERLGGPAAPTLAEAYAGASVVLLSSAVEGFPPSLVEAMFCGRATVSTDTGAVREVIGGTGLVVPPGDPRALAEAALALLGDPGRRARLGAAARARAVELFTVEQNVTAFCGIYLELMSRHPVRAGDDRPEPGGTARPFERTADSATADSATPDSAAADSATPESATPAPGTADRRRAETARPTAPTPGEAPGGAGSATAGPRRRVPSWAREPSAGPVVPVAAGAAAATGRWEGTPE
ncbi:glycosyltransferase, partial [Streptomyces durbertensis]|uniref:glycosyltransferase n=1 Tax=Streptomyces durbertensis TaxID=2448886 RepID=UPI001E30D1F7